MALIPEANQQVKLDKKGALKIHALNFAVAPSLKAIYSHGYQETRNENYSHKRHEHNLYTIFLKMLKFFFLFKLHLGIKKFLNTISLAYCSK